MTTAPVFDHLTALADPIRSRALLALERHELTVSELQQVLQLPQSTVSRHLKVLGDEGWVVARPDRASHRYRFASQALGSSVQRLWALVREEIASTRAAQRDTDRVRAVLARRHTRSREFFDTEAGQWDRLREELFGRRFELQALLGLLDPAWVVGDLGCGTGHLTAALAPFVKRVIAVDESAPMLEAARGRLTELPNVDLRQGELELLPISEMELDVAILALVLPHVPEPGRVLAEAARALQPGGRLIIVDLQPHERVEYAQTMGHLWHGFEASQLRSWLSAAGLLGVRHVALGAEPAAKGPGLFVATAQKPS